MNLRIVLFLCVIVFLGCGTTKKIHKKDIEYVSLCDIKNMVTPLLDSLKPIKIMFNGIPINDCEKVKERLSILKEFQIVEFDGSTLLDDCARNAIIIAQGKRTKPINEILLVK